MTSKSAMWDERPDAVLIAGPTASGKSSFALELAEKWNGTIINADSMQVYPVLRVLTARPPEQDLTRIPHVLYGHARLDEPYSVARWLDDVEEEMGKIIAKGRLPIFTGGTGLYFKALVEGLARIPEIPEKTRLHWRNRLEEDGLEVLFSELQQRDHEIAAKLRANDRQRILRALEVIDATGKSILFHQSAGNSDPVLQLPHIKRFVFSPPREKLRERVDQRLGWMMENGALDEVAALLEFDVLPDHPVMKAIGVSQISRYLAEEISYDEALEKSRIATRQYAKRQSTWFRNQLGDDWVTVR